MKRRNFSILASMLVLLVLLSLGGNYALAQGQNPPEKPFEVTANASTVSGGFTYQGTLKASGLPANGYYDFRFDLYSTSTGVSLLGSNWLYVSNVNVVNGLFTIKLDFSTIDGSNYFTGDARWLAVWVSPAGQANWTPLTPYQELTAVPYALGLMPGATVQGTPYQTLKVQNYYPTTGVPAAVSGEIWNSTDGAGVNGVNYVSTAGATGVGVWGRTYGSAGVGVLGNGYNGAIGVKGIANSDGGIGVKGENNTSPAQAIGVIGVANHASCSSALAGCSGVRGESAYGAGVVGYTTNGVGVLADSGGTGPALRAVSQSADLIQAYNGSSNLRFEVTNSGNVYADGTYTSPASDLAEHIPATGILLPGDVVEIDPNTPGQFRLAATPNSTLVAGVISTQPGMSLGAGDPDEDGNTGPQLALAGRVPVKVSAENGAIHPGDLLVASSTPGYAMRAPANPAPGTVIGKALGKLDSGTGLIDMLVMLR
jgi:hypothetical protein